MRIPNLTRAGRRAQVAPEMAWPAHVEPPAPRPADRLAFVALTPFLWLICACFKQQKDVFGYAFLPWGHLRDLTIGQLPRPLRPRAFGRWLLNSLFLSSTQTVLVVTPAASAASRLAKYRFAGKRVLMLLMLGHHAHARRRAGPQQLAADVQAGLAQQLRRHPGPRRGQLVSARSCSCRR